MILQNKVDRYIELRTQIEELERQKKELSAEILELIPKDTANIHLPNCRVKRASLLSIRISLENAKQFGAIRMKEVVDRDKIKELYKAGQNLPDVSEVHYVQVYTGRKEEEEIE